MTIVPEGLGGRIRFYTSRVPVWAEDPTSIGLTADVVAAQADLLAAARAAEAAHVQAQQAARTATAAYRAAVRRLHAGGDGAAGGAALIQQIKAFAQVTGDAGVYPRASLPPPTAPGRPGSAPAPGKPQGFTVTLRAGGEIELAWRCDNTGGAAGTIYQVRRSIGQGDFQIVGTVGAKSFLDRTLPPGTASCTYEVTALRSTGKGEPACFSVNLGGSGSGVVFQSTNGRKLVA